MLLSFYKSRDPSRAWNVAHAAAYGGIIGALAATFKTFGPAHAGVKISSGAAEIVLAALAFALLCSAAALLRNLITQRLVGRETP